MKVNTYRVMVRGDLEAGDSDLFQGIISMFIPLGNPPSNNSKSLESFWY
jgi:hypothetical protein